MAEEQAGFDLCCLTTQGVLEVFESEGYCSDKCGCFFCVGTERKNKPTLDFADG